LLLADLTVSEDWVVEEENVYLEVEEEMVIGPPEFDEKTQAMEAPGLADTKHVMVTSLLVKTL
jgi:hypothetical protein